MRPLLPLSSPSFPSLPHIHTNLSPLVTLSLSRPFASQAEGAAATVIQPDLSSLTTKPKGTSILARENEGTTTTATTITTTTMRAVTANTSINAIALVDVNNDDDVIPTSSMTMTKRKHRTEGTLDGDGEDDGDEEGEKKEQEDQELALPASVSAVSVSVAKEGKGIDKGMDKDKDDAAYTMSMAAKAAADARHTETRAGTKITTMEERATGDITWPIYLYYIKGRCLMRLWEEEGEKGWCVGGGGEKGYVGRGGGEGVWVEGGGGGHPGNAQTHSILSSYAPSIYTLTHPLTHLNTL